MTMRFNDFEPSQQSNHASHFSQAFIGAIVEHVHSDTNNHEDKFIATSQGGQRQR